MGSDNKGSLEISRDYSEKSFWDKIANFAKQAGREVIEKALILYYALQDKDVPAKAKAIIIGALSYFILPLDVIPDIAPGIGFADDLGVLAAAVAAVAIHVTKETKEKAATKVSEWFD